jgi:hypothetical protein
MFKLAALLCVVAAAATAPPRISLDLDAITKMGQASLTQHKDASKQPHSQDFTERCPAGASTDNTNCPFPAAKAYDHHDKEVQVNTRVYLVDADGKTANRRVGSVDFTKRSTYLFKYDATDAAGNKASQVVFALILDDTTKPSIATCGGEAETVEAATAWKLCKSSATDNIDGVITKAIKYTVKKVGGSVLVKDGTYAQAAQKLHTKQTGQFLVTMKVSDNAKVYGKNGQSNTRVARKAILMQDTTAPVIAIHGSNPAFAQCNYKKTTTYQDAGAGAADTLDGPIVPLTHEHVNTKFVGDYVVRYTASDKAGNGAKAQKRTVTVRDTIKPFMALKGSKHIVVHSQTKMPEPGVTVHDSCDKRLNNKAKKYTMSWNKKYTDRVIGNYIRTYSTQDQSGNKNSIKRTFQVIDVTAPIMEIHGNDVDTVEAKNGAIYQDKGATCEDYVDGKSQCWKNGHFDDKKNKKCHHHKGDKPYVAKSNMQIIKEGKVVMNKPGTYTIKYSCMDKSANLATTTRKVVVRDTTCPKIAMKGKAVNYVEAGFPYHDAGATARDNLDGIITNKIVTDGDTVNTANAFYSRQSCKDIKANHPKTKSGNYFITRFTGAGKAVRVNVWCDMTTANAMTFKACVNCKKRVNTPYFGKNARKNGRADCAKYGMDLAKLSKDQLKSAKGKWAKGINFFPTTAGVTDDYICSTNDEVKAPAFIGDAHAHGASTLKTKNAEIARAEAGKFVIFYHVQDKAGNKECQTPRRVVIVKDTLAPVITLHLKRALIHKSAPGKKGLGGQYNPAGTKSNPYLMRVPKTASFFGNNSFMAETSSVNGWMIAAAACAVTGVALLSFSSKSTTTIEV